MGMGMMAGGGDVGAMVQSMVPMMRIMMARDTMRLMRSPIGMMPFEHVEGHIAFLKASWELPKRNRHNGMASRTRSA
jgi:hypothetical protein